MQELETRSRTAPEVVQYILGYFFQKQIDTDPSAIGNHNSGSLELEGGAATRLGCRGIFGEMGVSLGANQRDPITHHSGPLGAPPHHCPSINSSSLRHK